MAPGRVGLFRAAKPEKVCTIISCSLGELVEKHVSNAPSIMKNWCSALSITPTVPQKFGLQLLWECQAKSESRVGIPTLQEQAQRCAVDTLSDFVWTQTEKQFIIDLLGRIHVNFDRNYDNVRMDEAYRFEEVAATGWFPRPLMDLACITTMGDVMAARRDGTSLSPQLRLNVVHLVERQQDI